jgi:hypothetical protein
MMLLGDLALWKGGKSCQVQPRNPSLSHLSYNGPIYKQNNSRRIWQIFTALKELRVRFRENTTPHCRVPEISLAGDEWKEHFGSFTAAWEFKAPS